MTRRYCTREMLPRPDSLQGARVVEPQQLDRVTHVARPVLRRIAFVVFAQRIGLSLEEIGAELAKLPPDRAPTRRDWTRAYRASGALESTSESRS